MMSEPSPFRLIAADVDGTLVDSRKRIPSFTRHELQRVTRDYGLGLVLASTRMPASLRQIQNDLGIAGPLIAYNGALVIHPSDPSISHSDPLDDASASALIGDLLSRPIHVGVFSGDRWFVSDVDYWALREVRGTRVWPHRTPLRAALEGGAIFPVHKVLFRGDSGELGRVVDSVAASLDGLSIARDRETIVEVTRRSASKASALKYLLDASGIPASSVIAFGDGYSDLSMLESVGAGIAMHNAADAVRSAADETTLSNDEDGVGYALRKYFPVTDRWISPSAG